MRKLRHLGAFDAFKFLKVRLHSLHLRCLYLGRVKFLQLLLHIRLAKELLCSHVVGLSFGAQHADHDQDSADVWVGHEFLHVFEFHCVELFCNDLQFAHESLDFGLFENFWPPTRRRQ